MRRIGLFALLLLIVSACSAEVAPTATATATATLTPTPTETPAPLPTPLPSILELTRATDPSQQAYLSVVNAAADAPIFDVYVERLAIATNLNFGQFTQPSGIVAGDYFLRVVPNGVRPDAGEVYYETPIALKGGDSLLLIFTGTSGDMVMSYFAQPLEPLDAEQSRVTVIHAMPGGPELTVQQSGVPLTGSIPFGSAAYPVTLTPGDVTLEFQSGGAIVLSYPITLRERFSYVLVIAGNPNDLENAKIIEMRNSVPGRASVRAINASPTIGPVDIYLDAEALTTGLDYTRASDTQPKAAQVYAVKVYPAGADLAAIEPLLSSQVVANNDDIITLLLLGSPQSLQVIPYREDRSRTEPERSRIAFVDTLEQVPTVRIETQMGILTDVGQLGYAQQPHAIELPSGTYRFVWMQLENGSPTNPVEIADEVVLEPGRAYLYLMTGRLGDPPIILSDVVGIDQGTANLPTDELPTATPEVPTQVRFVNAINGGLPVDIVVDQQPAAAALSYGSASPLSAITAGTHTVEVRLNGQTLTSLEMPFELATPYTLIAYGFGTDRVELFAVDDTDVFQSGNPPHARIINLTAFGELTLGLAYSAAETASDSSTIFSESPGSDVFRRSLAFGIDRARNVEDTPGRAYSNVALAPLGPHDAHIVDTRLNMIAASYRQLDFQPGVHYDIIAYQHPDSLLVEGFALRYPGA